jgi:hypothetical protein
METFLENQNEKKIFVYQTEFLYDYINGKNSFSPTKYINNRNIFQHNFLVIYAVE